jgi:uncharacterized repeat protein (TIGR03803 family)
MANLEHRRTWIFGNGLRVATIALTMAMGFVLTLVAQSAQAQTFTVLHSFTGGADGQDPEAGLAINGSGDLFGTAVSGGNTGGPYCGTGCGTVFRLSHKGSVWVFTRLYAFQGGNDGWEPYAGVTFDSDGNLYGTTHIGGGIGCSPVQGCGTVFKLRPSLSVCQGAQCLWVETILYRFTGDSDGAYPGYGALVFDRAGNIYGTASGAGSGGQGTVYKLASSGGGWMESVLYSFTGGTDGGSPRGPVIFDQVGNIYDTTFRGGLNNGGTVFQLTPTGSGWTQSTLHSFSASNGENPFGGLIFDHSGNLYGTTSLSGPGNKGTVYQLSPLGGSWTFTSLYSFQGTRGYGPTSGLAIDATGNLYGTAANVGAYGYGLVFELSPHSDGSWTFTDLHDFTGGIDGAQPLGNITLDSAGNLYSTTVGGGSYGRGVVFEITPH